MAAIRLALHISAAALAAAFRAPAPAPRSLQRPTLLPSGVRARGWASRMSVEEDPPRAGSRLPLLPSEVAARPSQARTIDVDGHSLTLDELGPIIIKEDGRLGSLANWHEMTEAEKSQTLTFIARRNAQRRKALLERQAEQAQAD
jgi:hypothetical protein